MTFLKWYKEFRISKIFLNNIHYIFTTGITMRNFIVTKIAFWGFSNIWWFNFSQELNILAFTWSNCIFIINNGFWISHTFVTFEFTSSKSTLTAKWDYIWAPLTISIFILKLTEQAFCATLSVKGWNHIIWALSTHKVIL